MKCNLDCDYCTSDLYGGHDNSQSHPPLAQCLAALDFMYEYADRAMRQKIPSIKDVVLNVYGGEALHHPNIVEILQAAKQKHLQYQDRWRLTVTTTTNAVIPVRKFEQIVDFVDEFTVSWHSQNSAKHKQQFRDNVLYIQNRSKRLKCIVMMHPDFFEDGQEQIEWCKQNNVKYLPKQIDHDSANVRFNYYPQQILWFEKTYNHRNFNSESKLIPITDRTDLTATGRACCGGRQLCANQNYRQRESFVSNQFQDWYCSVDKFFLYVKQVNGEVYVNKDCKMNYNGEVGAIGNLQDVEPMLSQINSRPVIKCAKSSCLCGLCAPKAADLDTYNSIMKKYLL